MNIVFLDEFTLGGNPLTAIKAIGNYEGYYNTAPEQIAERCKEADVVIVNKVKLGECEFVALPDLKLVCVAATGMNNIDLDAAKRHNVAVRNAVGYSTDSVAETTLCSAIALLRQLTYYDRYVKQGDYSRSGLWVNYDRPTHTLKGKNWGIVGLGNIGRRVASLATTFGCSVAYASVSGVAREESYPLFGIDKLLGWADILSIHCPLSERSVNLINADRLSLMKSSAIVINVARGGIVNESDTVDALNRCIIAGAAFDVYPTEPMPIDSPLLRADDPTKLLLSPHNAWSSQESVENLANAVARNVADFFDCR